MDDKGPGQLGPRVTGIGGIFLISSDATKLKDWYKDHLNLKLDDYGAVFETRNSLNSEELNYLRWSVFGSDTTYFEGGKNNVMINYRVFGIEALVEQMKKNGVSVLDEIEEFEYGKFVHVVDADGNKMELWEPIDSFLTQMGGVTNK